MDSDETGPVQPPAVGVVNQQLRPLTILVQPTGPAKYCIQDVTSPPTVSIIKEKSFVTWPHQLGDTPPPTHTHTPTPADTAPALSHQDP